MTDLRSPSLVLNCIAGRETLAAELNSVWRLGKKDLP
jgi:hypothetical protein